MKKLTFLKGLLSNEYYTTPSTDTDAKCEQATLLDNLVPHLSPDWYP